jgi:hypothetical protein
MTQPSSSVATLTALGQKLRTVFTALDEANDLFAEAQLENAFFDGVLTEKLTALTFGATKMLELVVDLTQSAIHEQAEAEVAAIVERALETADAVESGAAFGFVPCEGCQPGDCPDNPKTV